MNEIWQIALAIIGSFGGAGVIILACSRWLANITAKAIIKKTEFEFSKKLEGFKSQLENKNYISKVRFDLEIEIYRELSASTMEMVMKNQNLFPHRFNFSPKDKDERVMFYQKNYEEATETFNTANKSILRNAPFIPEDFYKMFIHIIDLCSRQIDNYIKYGDFAIKDVVHADEIKIARDECFQRTLQIDKGMKELAIRLREHIASLDVLDKST